MLILIAPYRKQQNTDGGSAEQASAQEDIVQCPRQQRTVLWQRAVTVTPVHASSPDPGPAEHKDDRADGIGQER